nr:hypothetical protein [Noviherbaspirillum soli]
MKIMSALSWICRCRMACRPSHNVSSGFGTGPDNHLSNLEGDQHEMGKTTSKRHALGL